MNEAGSILHDGFLLLGFALAFVLLFRRLGLGATLGYLLAGAVVGPQALGLVGQAEQKLGFAELGITLLLFLVGLELDPARLWRMKKDILGLGLLQVTLCGLAVAGVIFAFTDFSAAAALALGLSTALGAFIAGVMLADSPYRHELEADVEPFRSILLGLFFLAVGMMLDLGAIARNPVFVLSMAAALIAVKAAVMFGLARLFGMGWRPALALGLLLSQGGEFGFVLFAQAQHALLIAPEAASVFGAVVTLSMATTPFLMMATRRFREAPADADEEREGPGGERVGALIVGYGRFGQTVGQMMLASGIDVTLIDTDVEMIDVAGKFGAKVYFGDGTRIDMLRQAGAAEAEMILFCLDGDQLSADLIEAAHEAFPNAAIYVRAFDRRAMVRLRDAPTTLVVREVLESAVVMARAALDNFGLSQEAINKAEAFYRKRDNERLEVQIAAGDVRAAHERVITETGDAGAAPA